MGTTWLAEVVFRVEGIARQSRPWGVHRGLMLQPWLLGVGQRLASDQDRLLRTCINQARVIRNIVSLATESGIGDLGGVNF